MLIQRISSDTDRIRFELEDIGVDPYALSMADKGIAVVLKLSALKPGAANVVKQEAIAAGMDAAVARGTVTCSVETTDLLLLGTRRTLGRLLKRLKVQPFGLAAVSEHIEAFLKQERPKLFVARGMSHLLDEPKVMGILNITPDSFSDGGKFTGAEAFSARLRSFMDVGVSLVDIGGMSSRPGAVTVSAEEECARVLPAVIEAKKMRMVVSVDTWRRSVAEEVLKEGADIINDISGFRFDPDVVRVAADYGAAVCVMHMRGTPDTMQQMTDYRNLLEEIKKDLLDAAETAMKAGIRQESVIIDPGFGFAKTASQNYTLLKYLDEFTAYGFPLLVGVSRKSMIGAATGREVGERLAGTLAVTAIALEKGADIIRAHDVRETVDVVKVIQAMKQQ